MHWTILKYKITFYQHFVTSFRAQKRFQDFLEDWKLEGTDDLKYKIEGQDLAFPERNTLQVKH